MLRTIIVTVSFAFNGTLVLQYGQPIMFRVNYAKYEKILILVHCGFIRILITRKQLNYKRFQNSQKYLRLSLSKRGNTITIIC